MNARTAKRFPGKKRGVSAYGSVCFLNRWAVLAMQPNKNSCKTYSISEVSI